MREQYTLKQTAAAIGVSAQIVRAWLAETGITTTPGKDKRARYLTRAQVVTLARAHQRAIQDDVSVAALAGQLQALSVEVDALQRRVAALEQPKKIRAAPGFPQSIMAEQPGGPLSRLRAAFDPDPARRAAFHASVLLKREICRLIAERHGVAADIAKNWPWPTEALASAHTAIAWALAYVAHMESFRRPREWRWQCDVESCPCHQQASSAV